MIGFPKVLNTKKDYLNVLTDYPTETKTRLENLLNDRFIWVDKGEVKAGEFPIEDDTHRIVIDNEGKQCQLELIEDTNALMFRLGFTVEEIETILAGE